MKELRICKICNKEFYATNGMQLICKSPHYDTCVICGTTFEIPRSMLSDPTRARCCSRKCSAALRRQTCQTKYGGSAPAASSKVRAKMQSTTLARMGVKFACQSESALAKMRETTKSKYGVDYYLQTPECREQLNQTCQDKFGCEWPSQSSEVRAKCKQTSIDRYGTEYPTQSRTLRNHIISQRMTDNTKLDKFLKYKANPKQFILDLNLNHKPTIYELTDILGVNASTVGAYAHKFNCADMLDLKVSVMEQDVVAELQKINPDIQVDLHRRDIIPPKEVDIYLPEYSIAIECNPSATHNSTINVFDGTPSTISSRYHLDKTKACQAAGITLLHIFGPEWKHKRNIMISILRNMLKCNDRKIYGRNCDIRDIDSTTCANFLIANHRQGYANSPIRLGLYYEDELVAVMTFSKLRRIVSRHSDIDSDTWELVRFCSLLNTTVVGGASKLFKYFCDTYSINTIRSFSDNAHTTGGIYTQLGFVRIRDTEPNYIWVEANTDNYLTRYQTQRYNLPRLFDDVSDTSLSETAILTAHGYVKLFDCGSTLWEWHRI